jgi:CotS family spore coat protein
MNNQIYDISVQFGINPYSISRSKYFYIIHGSGGVYSLCTARPTPDRLTFLHKIKEGLIQNGFKLLDRYITAKDGNPYIICDGSVYTMTSFFGMNELDFTDNEQCLSAMRSIGKMHSAAALCEPTEPFIRKYENGVDRLKKIKKIVSAKKSPSDMDLLFKKTYNDVASIATIAVEKLKKLNADNQKCIYIHNSLKEDNLIYNKGRVYIIDWDNARTDNPATDIAFFIRRYIRKNAYYAHLNGTPYLSLNDLLSAYISENAMSDAEKDILSALLEYPSRYINVISEFYKKQRNFIPSSLGMKAEEISAQWDFTTKYLSDLK